MILSSRMERTMVSH